MIEHPCMLRAREQDELDRKSPLWREHFTYRVFVERESKPRFTGSSKACMIAVQAFPNKKYRIVDCTDKAMVTNR